MAILGYLAIQFGIQALLNRSAIFDHEGWGAIVTLASIWIAVDPVSCQNFARACRYLWENWKTLSPCDFETHVTWPMVELPFPKSVFRWLSCLCFECLTYFHISLAFHGRRHPKLWFCISTGHLLFPNSVNWTIAPISSLQSSFKRSSLPDWMSLSHKCYENDA